MAMWRDPLDELIADLERVVPSAAPFTCDIPSMTDYCYFGRSMFSHDPAERARLAEDPRVKRVWEYHQRLPPWRPSSDPVKPPG